MSSGDIFFCCSLTILIIVASGCFTVILLRQIQVAINLLKKILERKQ